MRLLYRVRLSRPTTRFSGSAPPIQEYVLLWASFLGVADGGIDLVYSKKEQRIGWEFYGSVRG